MTTPFANDTQQRGRIAELEARNVDLVEQLSSAEICVSNMETALASAEALNERLVAFIKRICKADPNTAVFAFMQEDARTILASIEKGDGNDA